MTVATTLLCGATMGGLVAFSGDGGAISPWSHSSQSIPCPAFQGGSTPATRTTSTTATAVPQVKTSSVGGGAGSSSSSFNGSASTSSNGNEVSMNLTYTGFGNSGSASGGGGGAASGSSSGSYSSDIASMTSSIAMASIGASAPQRVSGGRRDAAQGGEQGLDVYNGDAPGVIFGDDNLNLDNPIISCYGLPIGDVLWPLLLMAMVYCLYVMGHSLRHTRK